VAWKCSCKTTHTCSNSDFTPLLLRSLPILLLLWAQSFHPVMQCTCTYCRRYSVPYLVCIIIVYDLRSSQMPTGKNIKHDYHRDPIPSTNTYRAKYMQYYHIKDAYKPYMKMIFLSYATVKLLNACIHALWFYFYWLQIHVQYLATCSILLSSIIALSHFCASRGVGGKNVTGVLTLEPKAHQIATLIDSVSNSNYCWADTQFSIISARR
jgi:hypothetical protein